ncbi:MAG: hypothetical protein ACE15F_11835 [bacterium]
MEIRIIAVQYYPVEDLESIIRDLFGIEDIHLDQFSNRLILQAPVEQMEKILALISELDVAVSQPAEDGSIMFRVYLFEIPSVGQAWKNFSAVVKTPQINFTLEVLKNLKDSSVQISDILTLENDYNPQRAMSRLESNSAPENLEKPSQDRGKQPGPRREILIQGRAESNEALMALMEKIPESNMTDLRWDDTENFIQNLESAQLLRLPESLQAHLRNFLGNNIQTIGYWFGTASDPGEIDSPLGPFHLKMRLSSEPGIRKEVSLDVEVEQPAPPFGRDTESDSSRTILSNRITAKIGHPIIICYNRNSYGVRKLGALVILPETGKMPVDPSDSTTTP